MCFNYELGWNSKTLRNVDTCRKSGGNLVVNIKKEKAKFDVVVTAGFTSPTRLCFSSWNRAQYYHWRLYHKILSMSPTVLIRRDNTRYFEHFKIHTNSLITRFSLSNGRIASSPVEYIHLQATILPYLKHFIIDIASIAYPPHSTVNIDWSRYSKWRHTPIPQTTTFTLPPTIYGHGHSTNIDDYTGFVKKNTVYITKVFQIEACWKICL